MQDHLKKYYGSLLEQSEKRPVKKPAMGASPFTKMSFKKKKETVEVRPKAEEVIVEEKPAPKKATKPRDGSYLDRMTSKIESGSKKEVPKVAFKSERKDVVSTKKKNSILGLPKKLKNIDLRIESLKTVMKPPKSIMSLIEDEYADIVSMENAVTSLRSIQTSKNNSLANSKVSNVRSQADDEPPQPASPLLNAKRDTQFTFMPHANNVGADPLGRMHQSEVADNLRSPGKDAKPRSSEPGKFVRFSEFHNREEPNKRATSYLEDRLTFQGPADLHNKNFEPAPDLSAIHHVSSQGDALIAVDDQTDFSDIFTPKEIREPVESLPRVFSMQQDEFEPNLFVKKVHSKENMLESLQQGAFLERKGAKVMDTEALFDSDKHVVSTREYGSNVFEPVKEYVHRTDPVKASANFNHGLEGEYQTSNFGQHSNPESEKELLENINNLIEQNYGDELDHYRHKRPLHATSFNRSEDEKRPTVFAQRHTDADESLEHALDQPERMKRVITFANVHKLAQPTAEDEEFIRNYYANKDYPKAITDEEDEDSRDSLDVPDSKKGLEDGAFSVKSDRFHEELGENRNVRFQSVTTSKMVAESAPKPGSLKHELNILSSAKLKSTNTVNFAQWEANYVSKDTQDIDNNILDEINAIYKNTSRVHEEKSISEDSENERFNNTDRNMFLVASKDHSFDDEDQKDAFKEAPDNEYFTLANMVVQSDNIQTVDMLTSQLDEKMAQLGNKRATNVQTLEETRQPPQPTPQNYESESSEEPVAPLPPQKEKLPEEGNPKPAFQKRSSVEFEDKFNELIIRMLNKKAALIQNYWRSKQAHRPRDIVLADLFREFVRIKRRNENFVRKNCDMKGVQTSNYSIKIIQKEFVAYLDDILEDAPNADELMQLVGDLGLLMKKLGISGN